jgi:hypothetical protein
VQLTVITPYRQHTISLNALAIAVNSLPFTHHEASADAVEIVKRAHNPSHTSRSDIGGLLRCVTR